MLEEERRRQQFLEGSVRAVEVTRGVVEHSIQSFAMNRDLDVLLESAKEALEIARRYYPLAPISFASLYTDQFALRRGELNKEIIQRSKERGVSPWPNFMGERLQATTCLAQLLERFAEDQK